MKFVFALAAVLLLTAGFNFTAIEPASASAADPAARFSCPRRIPFPMRRLVVRPGPVAVAPCGAGCVSGAAAYAAPPPCGQGGCGGTAFVYFPKRFYAYWKQPGYTACYPGPGNCYWRRDCWYDSFGRRFCN